MREPTSVNIERSCLSSIILKPEILTEISFVNERDFAFIPHQTLFSLCKSTYEEKKKIDSLILIERAKGLGLSTVDNIPIYDYVEALEEISKINEDNILDYFVELKKYSISRSIFRKAEEVKKYIVSNINDPAPELITETQRIFTNCVTENIKQEGSAVDLHGNIRNYIEELGNNPKEDGIIPPFPLFYKKYGGLLVGDFTIFAAPYGAGKSTLLNYISINAALDKRNKCKVLILDTELETERVMRRRVASLSGVGEFYLRTGKWRYNADMVKKVRDALDICEACKGKVDHKYVANLNIQDIVSFVRRWAANELDKGVTPLIVYDYLKLTGEKVSESWKEYQVMGQKTDTIKHLLSEVGATGIAAVQTNQAGDVAMAQQIKWFASNLYSFIPKTIDEISEHGEEFGTHKLYTIKTRNQGEEADGFARYITTLDDKGNKQLIENFINFNVENFNVKEVGTYESILKRHSGDMSLTEDNSIVDLL